MSQQSQQLREHRKREATLEHTTGTTIKGIQTGLTGSGQHNSTERLEGTLKTQLQQREGVEPSTSRCRPGSGLQSEERPRSERLKPHTFRYRPSQGSVPSSPSSEREMEKGTEQRCYGCKAKGKHQRDINRVCKRIWHSRIRADSSGRHQQIILLPVSVKKVKRESQQLL